MWECSVFNCGNGSCVHKLLKTECPLCGCRMVEVSTTGFRFCSAPPYPYSCDYEDENESYMANISEQFGNI